VHLKGAVIIGFLGLPLEIVGFLFRIEKAVKLNELQDHAILASLLGHGVGVGLLLA
jgi:hypothetical protein